MSLTRKRKWCRINLKRHGSGQVDMGDLARAHQKLSQKLDRQRGYYRLARDFMSVSDRIGVVCEAKLIKDKIAGIEMAMSQIVQAAILAGHSDLTQSDGNNAKENE